MEVLNKLRNTVSNTISNTVNQTAYGLSQLSNVLPGNPVTREYEVISHVASAGPGLLWKVYSGYKKSTRQEAAIFLLEKRQLERWSSRQEREAALECLKRGVSQLTKLRHPQVLTVQHPLEESRDCVAFATEPVFASLANVLGNLENAPQPVPASLKDFKLQDVEKRYGLLQLGEGLAFLHNDVKALHRNLTPESVVINGQGAWKIFGFDFCALNQSAGQQPSWTYVEYDPTLPMVVQPNLDFQAPECLLASSATPASDIFSLGMLIYALHSPGNRPLHEAHNDIAKCRRFLGELKNSSVGSQLFKVPDALRDIIKLMMSTNPELRPNAHQFIKIDYFMDIGVKTLNYLDKLFQWDNLQKSQFYKGLPQVVKQLPHRVVLHRVLPALYKEFVNPQMIPFVLPTILLVMESCSGEEFRSHILQSLKPVLALEEPPQISLVLMQKVDLLLKLCPPDVIKNDVVPMLTRALDSRMEQLQELCLNALPSISTLIEGPVMKNAILTRIQKVCLRGKETGSSLGIRVNCLLCLAKMLENLDRWIVIDQILPFLQEIPHSGEPAIVMAIIGIYKMILTHSKLGISKELLATKVLPFLLPLCVEQNLSPSQYEVLASLVGDMINRVTTEHRSALKQLDAVRREAQQLDQALTQTVNSPIYSNSMDNSFTPTSPSSSSITPSNSSNENGLSMQEKYRLVQQQEAHQRLQSQSPLTPKTATPMSLKQEPKDLTHTLLQNNLEQLNLSVSKTASNYNPMNTQITTTPAWRNSNSNYSWNQTTNVNHSITNNSSNWSTVGFSPIGQMKLATSPIGMGMSLQSPTSPVQNASAQTQLSTQDIMDLLS